MKFEHVHKMSVIRDIESKPRKLGTLAWSNAERRAYFEYATEFLSELLLVSPFHLMANAGIIAAPRDPFDGLHGLLNDSLPDGWGRMLLDRLSAVGTSGMGALSFALVQHQMDAADLDTLQGAQGGSAGA
ncbi:HipA N-terminal domain-containing protein [Neorhizobium sp. JUb45]|uniref:HipA N-terminal domain-containing protein n=1 Tax=Neorhizobium sp. JUb45 TaxID=2485113 RepID=UPI0010E72511|nr:HipA N-terminal domain-containing protein [Neorhizobium sp. JUb45]TCQ98055.1 HipA-like protein [Neorhizobium sp. JUb45]